MTAAQSAAETPACRAAIQSSSHSSTPAMATPQAAAWAALGNRKATKRAAIRQTFSRIGAAAAAAKRSTALRLAESRVTRVTKSR